MSLVGFLSTFPFPSLYWYGVGAFYAGLGALAVGALLEQWRLGYRITVCMLWVGAAVLVSVKAVLLPAPLEVAAVSTPAPYKVGEDVFGIAWEQGMTELRLVIHNRTTYDYDDVDISFRPDVPTRKVVQITKFPDISFMLTPGSDRSEAEIVQINNHAADVYASQAGFRMRCPKIPKHSTVEVLVALIVPPDKVPPNPNLPPNARVEKFISISGVPDDLIPRQPTMVYAKGGYIVLNRPHQLEFTYGVSP